MSQPNPDPNPNEIDILTFLTKFAMQQINFYSVYDALVLFKVYTIDIETIKGWLNAVLEYIIRINFIIFAIFEKNIVLLMFYIKYKSLLFL